MPSTSNTAKKFYAISRFGLDIDGHDLTDYVKNVEGGMLKSESVKEQTGSFNLPSMHLGPKTVEPITMEIGLTKSNWLLGMVEKVDPGTPVQGRGYERRSLRLPITIEDALAQMEDCEVLREYLGGKFVQGYVAVKRAEHENFKRVISSWEREFLLLSV